jgi:cytochrome c peroxidase
MLGCSGKEQNTASPAERTKAYLKDEAILIEQAVQKMVSLIQSNANKGSIQQEFETARKHYKHVEFITELIFPGFSEAVNGPAIDEVEEYDNKIIKAIGFQVVEELLYTNEEINQSELLQEAQTLLGSLNRLQYLIDTNIFIDEHIFQAARLEIMRIISLGISGFDSPIAQKSIQEASWALTGLQTVLAFYKTTDDGKAAQESLARSIEYLQKQNSFNEFDRAFFITRYLNPVSANIHNYQKSLGINNRSFLIALDLKKNNFFDEGAFQMEHFTYPESRRQSQQTAELGKLLFFDPILSGNNKRSCASCHKPHLAFTDGKVKSIAFDFEGEISRNAPTLINSGFQNAQFLDSRVMFLEEQVVDVVSNPTEMHGHIEMAVQKILQSPEYVKLFEAAFEDDEPKVTNRKIEKALATYIRSLQGLNSRFDKYMRGDYSQLNETEVKGLNLFMGKAKCGTCHFMPLFNGTTPPMFTDTETEVLGVPLKPDTVNAVADPDIGKHKKIPGDLNLHSFKTTTVRNAALTAPYMHNGVYSTLEQVIDFYNRGGGAGIGIDLPNQTLPPDKLNLTLAEQKQLIAFIHALTDTVGISNIPARLPAFESNVLQTRKVGGEY